MEEKRDLRVDPNNVPPLIEGQCNFIITRKKRYCALKPVTENAFYCVEHLASVNGRKRIPCPLDSRHFIFEGTIEGVSKLRRRFRSSHD